MKEKMKRTLKRPYKLTIKKQFSKNTKVHKYEGEEENACIIDTDTNALFSHYSGLVTELSPHSFSKYENG